MRRMLALAALLVLPAGAMAQIDAEVDKPYELQVVLRCGAHNWLGKQFRDDLRVDLSGMLVDALGTMAQVGVVDLKATPGEQWHPLWKEVEAKGFAALDAPHELAGVKMHFVRIDFVNGQYEIQARQVDGQTGLVSPWRRDRTTDRAFVARLAGKMIAEDFGLIGTVMGRGDDVRVRFKASQGAHLERWVKPGDVFALKQVAPGARGGKERVYPVNDTLVKVTDEPKNGECPAKVVYRPRDNPLTAAPPGQGFRCIKLGTGRGPMRLRLVDDKGQPHTRTLQVRIHSEAFQKGESRDEEILNPDRGGLFLSRRIYDQVAYARIVTGAQQIARVPVPIQDDREVVVSVGLDAEQEQAGQLQAVRADLYRQYLDSLNVQNVSYEEIKALVNQAKNDLALKRSNAVRKALEEDVARLGVRKEDVKKQLTGTNISVADCDDAEQKLVAHKERINRLIGQLVELEQLENAPDKVERRTKLQQLKTKAVAMFDSDDYDGAIGVYLQIVKEYPEETKIKEQLEKLERDWAIRSDEHRQARDFVFREWPAVKSSAEVQTKTPVARQKLQVLQRVGDQLTIVKLRNTLPQIGKVLGDEITKLAQNNPDDSEALGKLKKIVEDFDKFQREVDAAVKAKAG